MRNSYKTICIFLGFICLLTGLFSCSEDPSQLQNIATAGQRKIDWQMVWQSFHLEPKWQRGLTNREAYFNQLNYLIDQKLFAQEAIAAGVDQIPSVKNALEFIQEKEIIKALYRRHVEGEIKITDDEFLNAYHRSKKKVKCQFIITNNQDRALAYSEKMRSVPFEQIRIFDSQTEQKGLTPLFGFGDMTKELEDFAFEMLPGEVSRPIRVGKVYVVLKVVDGQNDVLQTENDFNANKSKIQKVIFSRRARDVSDQYVYHLLKNEDIQINPKAFFPLAEQFSKIVQDKQTDTPLPVYLTNDEIQSTTISMKNLLDLELVHFGDQALTIKQFLEKLLNMPAGLRPQVNMKPMLKKAIAVVVRNEYLAEQAYREGIDRLSRVKHEIETFSDALLAHEWLRLIRDQISCSAEEIEAFKQKENFAEVNNRFGNKLTDSTIRNLISDYKFTQRKMMLADSLRQIYRTNVDTLRFEQMIAEPNVAIDYQPVGFAFREKFF